MLVADERQVYEDGEDSPGNKEMITEKTASDLHYGAIVSLEMGNQLRVSFKFNEVPLISVCRCVRKLDLLVT